MKKLLYIFALIATTSTNAQNIFPEPNSELCPDQEYTFSVPNLPGAFVGINSFGGATITQYPSGSGASIIFKGKFADVTGSGQIFEIISQGGTKQFKFTKIKSLFGGYSENFSNITSLNIPICQTTPINLNISGNKYWDASTSPYSSFGSITTYRYLLPAGWYLNSTLSNGNNWITATGGVTITPTTNTGNGATIQYVAKNDCSGAFYEGTPRYISISRPNPTFTLSPTSLTFVCGTPQTRTFTVSTSSSNSCSTSYNWSLGTNNGWLYNGSPAPASFSTTTSSITLTSVNANILPSPVSVVPVLNGIAQSPRNCTTAFSPFTITPSITGAAALCPTSIQSVYSIINAGSGNTVSWSLSNNSLAIILSSSNTSATVKGLINGTVSLQATVTNPCGQVVSTLPININIVANSNSITAPISYVTNTDMLKFCMNPQNTITCGIQTKIIARTQDNLKPNNFEFALQLGNAQIAQYVDPKTCFGCGSGIQPTYAAELTGKFYSSPIVVSVKANYACNVSSGNFVTYMSLIGVANRLSTTNNSYEIKVSPNKAKDFVTITKEDYDIPYQKVISKYLDREVSDEELEIMKNEIAALENSVKERTFVTIYDFNSKVVYSNEMTSNDLEINVTQYTKGLYIINVERGIEKVTQKLIVE